MPYTPFHLGPGVAIKSVIPRHFSFTVFGFSQIAMDLEPLFFMMWGRDELHGFFHTYIGATIIGFFSVLLGRPVCHWAIRLWNSRLSPRQSEVFFIEPRISVIAAVIGGFFGGYSHVFLDSFMHADLRPFAPFSNENSLLWLVTAEQMYSICVSAGIGGLSVMAAVALWRWGRT